MTSHNHNQKQHHTITWSHHHNQVDSDLEREFLVSSSEDEVTHRAVQARYKPQRYNPAREHYANLAVRGWLQNVIVCACRMMYTVELCLVLLSRCKRSNPKP